MSFTINDVLDVPHLGTRLIAGHQGTGRAVSWAHSIEMVAPWDWLGPGEMLMTIGLGVPATPADQETYVRRLAAAGVVGITIGEMGIAPPCSEEMLRAANDVGLPLMVTAREVPFSEISRAVATGSRGADLRRLNQLARIYELVREAVSDGLGSVALLDVLGQELDCRFDVVRDDTGTRIFPDAQPPSEEATAALRRSLAEHPDERPGLSHVVTDDGDLSIVPLTTRFPATLLSTSAAVRQPYAVLQHVATVASMEVERLSAERERLRRGGSSLFSQMLDGAIGSDAAVAGLATHGLTAPPFAMVLGADAAPGASARLHHDLAGRGVPHVLFEKDELQFCIVPVALVDDAVDAVGQSWACCGVSDPFSQATDVPGAGRQARWALEVCRTEARGVVRYGAQRSGVGPRTVDEAKDLVDQVLGRLVDYDGEHGSELVRTLDVFLSANRSWKTAAEVLFVHKQTVIYRVRRIEELTGRQTNETGDVAVFWLALRALETLD